jgi:cytochrome c biogenesis protein CcmG/thiol:disulfide interchange protein DsbE
MSSKNRGRAQQKKFWSPLRVVSTIIVLGLFAAFGISSCNSRDEKTADPTGVAKKSVKTAPPVGTNPAAPAALTSLPANVRDAELRAASGSPIKLSDYSGKVILVNLWATWCGPCRVETPELVKLHKEFQSRGVEMIGLSTENPDASAESVRNFVRTFNVDYRIGWATADVAITLMQGREAIPQSFIIARDGRIMKRFVGFRPGDTPDDTPQQIRQALEEALKG